MAKGLALLTLLPVATGQEQDAAISIGKKPRTRWRPKL